MEAPVCPKDSVATVPHDLVKSSAGDDAVGKVFSSRYRIEGLLGQGGFGRVYVATQLSMGRTVALKTLHPELVSDENHLQRFYLEARAASHLKSPHVVRIYDFGVDDETSTPFIAMEELEGRTLTEEIRLRGVLRPAHAARILGQVGQALEEAGGQGIVHRDLKPDNIFLLSTAGRSDFAKVMDFGIAKRVGQGQTSEQGVTATGVTVGTPTYMSPEQILAEQVDPRTDLYALGCILHECLTGKPPFSAEDRLALLMMHVNDPAPPLPERLLLGDDLPQEIAVLQQHLLSKKLTERPRYARAVVEVLSAVERGKAVDVYAILDSERTVQGVTPLAMETAVRERTVTPSEEGSAVDEAGADSEEEEDEATTANLPADAATPSSDLGPTLKAVSTPAPTSGSGSELTMLDTDETTRSAAVDEEPAAGGFGSPLRLGAIMAALLVIAAATVVWALSGAGGDAAPEPPAVEEEAAAPAAEPEDERPPEEQPAVGSAGPAEPAPEPVAEVTPPSPAPVEPPAPAAAAPEPSTPAAPPPAAVRVQVSLATKPPGAAVYKGRRRLCRSTPCTLPLAASKRPVVLTLRKEGYIDKRLKVTVSPEGRKSWTVPLIKDRQW